MQITPEDIINILDDKIYKKSNINMIRFRSKNISPNDYIKKARAYSMICIKNDIKLILDAKYYEYYQEYLQIFASRRLIVKLLRFLLLDF